MNMSVNSSSASIPNSVSSASYVQQQQRAKTPPAATQATAPVATQSVSKPVGNIGNNINIKA